MKKKSANIWEYKVDNYAYIANFGVFMKNSNDELLPGIYLYETFGWNLRCLHVPSPSPSF